MISGADAFVFSAVAFCILQSTVAALEVLGTMCATPSRIGWALFTLLLSAALYTGAFLRCSGWFYTLATVSAVATLWFFYIGCPRRNISQDEYQATSPIYSYDMRFEKQQDIFLLHHAYRLLGLLLIFGFVAIAFASYRYLPYSPDKIAHNFARFLGAGLVATFAIWAGRQFERQLQQGRFEKAISMIAEGKNFPEKRRAGIVLLDDLPRTFLWDKRYRIARTLEALGVGLCEISDVDLPLCSKLSIILYNANMKDCCSVAVGSATTPRRATVARTTSSCPPPPPTPHPPPR